MVFFVGVSSKILQFCFWSEFRSFLSLYENICTKKKLKIDQIFPAKCQQNRILKQVKLRIFIFIHT